MNKNRLTNDTPAGLIKNVIMCSAGLFFFAFGVYMTIQANIGVGPWDVLGQGVARQTGILYGNVLIIISLCVLAIDVFLREPIGLGMLLDTFIVGKAVNLFNYLDVIPLRSSLAGGIACMLAGIVLESATMYWYMGAALGCGPRDTLLVGLCKRFKRVPIGALNMAILVTCTFIGWRLGGQVGVGTLICAFLAGPILQIVFKLFKFDAAAVCHQNLMESLKVLRGINSQQ